jgi:iron complex transport system substrate-binding protein
VAGLIATLPKRPKLINLSPKCLGDLYVNIREAAEVMGTQTRGEAVVEGLQRRVETVSIRLKGIETRPRVLFLEWIDPLFGAGHWTPELIELAGGVCVVGTTGVPSVTLDWSTAAESKPDVVVVACCGYDIQRIQEDIPILTNLPGWNELPAVRTGEVYLIDGSQFFNRSGPRLVDSLEMLAATLHPECFADPSITQNVVKLKDDELCAA